MPETKAKPKADSQAKGNGLVSGANCVVAKGTKIEGNFHSTENLRLDGVIVGEVNCDQKLVMGEESRIEGKIKASEAVVMGTIVGDISVKGTLQLQSTARIDGKIDSRYMIVEEGAQFNGECKIGEQK